MFGNGLVITTVDRNKQSGNITELSNSQGISQLTESREYHRIIKQSGNITGLTDSREYHRNNKQSGNITELTNSRGISQD